LNFFSKSIKRKVTSVKKIIYSGKGQFGNILICLNKLILFCEILRCNEIALIGKSFWFIKHNIYLPEYNITINKIENESDLHYENNSQTIYYNSISIFYYLYKIRPKIRIHLFQNEIINNLPILNISKDDLYIHIRSGDIFKSLIHKPYAQPPLCFYESIFDNFNFSSIYIVSEDKYNPTVNKLITKFKNIIKSD